MQADANEATAVRQLQRAGPPDAPAEPIVKLGAAWSGLEAAEAKLKASLHARLARLHGPLLILERINRGVCKLEEWLEAAAPVLETAELGSSEAEVLALLADAEALAAEAGLRAAAHAALLPLAARLEGDAELFPRASEALFRVASVPSAGSQLAARIGRLKDELARQRRLAFHKGA